MISDGSIIVPLMRAVLILAPLAVCFYPSSPRSLGSPPFDALTGEWSGTGQFDGSEADLTRTWTRELDGEAVTSRLAVTMANGGSFLALVLFQRAGPDNYRAAWLDDAGRFQEVDATWDSGSGVVSARYIDRRSESGAWHRWEFQITGPASYVERVYRLEDAGPKLVSTFSFARRDLELA